MCVNFRIYCSVTDIQYEKSDGTYGNKTATAVSEFQSANNLTVTGKADLITQFLLVIRNSSFTQKDSIYIAQEKNYAVIIWPGKGTYYFDGTNITGVLSQSAH